MAKRLQQPRRDNPRNELVVAPAKWLVKAWSYANPRSHSVMVEIRTNEGDIGNITVIVPTEWDPKTKKVEDA